MLDLFIFFIYLILSLLFRSRQKIIDNINDVDVLFISPEALMPGENSQLPNIFNFLPPIAFVCIDEAHCLGEWSHHFRPAYLTACRILRDTLGARTFLGLTATANVETKLTIMRHLMIKENNVIAVKQPPIPHNLTLVVSCVNNRENSLVQLLLSPEFHPIRCIIIYCTRREDSERIARLLNDRVSAGIADFYHAGMLYNQRRTVQEKFTSGTLKIVVATNAFGMGINKQDVQGIIHYNMPPHFESYVQEVGRAGRNGHPAQCHMFLQKCDLYELQRHIHGNFVEARIISKLIKLVFESCSCKCPKHKITDDCSSCKTACPKHEVALPIERTSMTLDVAPESILTLLCYLELHPENNYITVLSNVYATCKVSSSIGLAYLRRVSASSRPLEVALASSPTPPPNSDIVPYTFQFSVVNVASIIGWNSVVLKHYLKQLEWVLIDGVKQRSPITVSFSDLSFRCASRGNLSDTELDQAHEYLLKMCTEQKIRKLRRVCYFYHTLIELYLTLFLITAAAIIRGLC